MLTRHPAALERIESDIAAMVARQAKRVSFQFSASGTRGAGCYYVTRNLPDNLTAEALLAEARKAGAVVLKRAGATTAALCGIENPRR